jgi:hypothetical protein
VCVYINTHKSSGDNGYMSESDLVMYISRRNDKNESFKMFRTFSLYQASFSYIKITEATKIADIFSKSKHFIFKISLLDCQINSAI